MKVSNKKNQVLGGKGISDFRIMKPFVMLTHRFVHKTDLDKESF